MGTAVFWGMLVATAARRVPDPRQLRLRRGAGAQEGRLATEHARHRARARRRGRALRWPADSPPSRRRSSAVAAARSAPTTSGPRSTRAASSGATITAARGHEPRQHAVVGALRRPAPAGADPDRPGREPRPQDRRRAHRGGACALRRSPRPTSGRSVDRGGLGGRLQSSDGSLTHTPLRTSAAAATRNARSTPRRPTCPGRSTSSAASAAPARRSRRCCSAPRRRGAATVLALVADVARAYFELRDFDRRLEISRRTLESRREYVELAKRPLRGRHDPRDRLPSGRGRDTIASRRSCGPRAARRTSRRTSCRCCSAATRATVLRGRTHR